MIETQVSRQASGSCNASLHKGLPEAYTLRLIQAAGGHQLVNMKHHNIAANSPRLTILGRSIFSV